MREPCVLKTQRLATRARAYLNRSELRHAMPLIASRASITAPLSGAMILAAPRQIRPNGPLKIGTEMWHYQRYARNAAATMARRLLVAP